MHVEKSTRKSSGRFSDQVTIMAKRISESHELSLTRSRKLLGLALTDHRVSESIMEYVNRVITGRGDGMTLIDVGENVEFNRLVQKLPLKRNKKNVNSKQKAVRKRSA
jgi:hypothetical protein